MAVATAAAALAIATANETQDVCWKYSRSRGMWQSSQKGSTVTLNARVPERAIGDMKNERYKQLESAKCN